MIDSLNVNPFGWLYIILNKNGRPWLQQNRVTTKLHIFIGKTDDGKVYLKMFDQKQKIFISKQCFARILSTVFNGRVKDQCMLDLIKFWRFFLCKTNRKRCQLRSVRCQWSPYNVGQFLLLELLWRVIRNF